MTQSPPKFNKELRGALYFKLYFNCKRSPVILLFEFCIFKKTHHNGYPK